MKVQAAQLALRVGGVVKLCVFESKTVQLGSGLGAASRKHQVEKYQVGADSADYQLEASINLAQNAISPHLATRAGPP